MANELFILARSLSLDHSMDRRSIVIDGFTCNEQELRAWMLDQHQIGAMPLKSAFDSLKTLGWTVLMVFPTDERTRKYYVNSKVHAYEGNSNEDAVDALQKAVDLMGSLKKTGTIWYRTANTMGNKHFVEGVEEQ